MFTIVILCVLGIAWSSLQWAMDNPLTRREQWDIMADDNTPVCTRRQR